MPFFTRDHVRLALQYLPDHTHPSLLSLLAMLRLGVPAKGIEGAIPFGSTQEHALLDDYFKAPGGTAERPWYLPFGRPKPTYPHWKIRTYGGTSLQAMRKERVWIYPHQLDVGGKAFAFGLAANLVGVLQTGHKKVLGAIPLSIHHLAAWMYREREVENHADAIAKFVAEFRLGEYGLVGPIFSATEDPALAAIPLGDAPATATEVVELLEPQPEEAGGSATARAPAEDEDTNAGSWDIDRAKLVTALGGLVGVEEAAVQALSALRSGMHVVLTGAPGSGKTELAQRICKAAEFVPWVVTATDSWTTFETIGGYFPKVSEGKESLDFEAGLLVSAMQQGKILIIDEINRADIDKAFGELFTLLSGSSVNLPFRRNDGGVNDGKRIRLQVPGDHDPGGVEIIAVPDWWRMVGAMNDADKASLKRLSFAFMRRFAFVPVPLPAPEDFEALIQDAAASTGLAASHPHYVEALKAIFARADGLRALELAMGFAIPKAMIKQAKAELGLDASRNAATLLGSGLELYLAPQLQGRADKHGEVLTFVEPRLDPTSRNRFAAALANWTGFDP